jgi:hypothetical protein
MSEFVVNKFGLLKLLTDKHEKIVQPLFVRQLC